MTICKSIEDKFHFIFECQIYAEIRNNYIPRYYRQRPSMLKTVELFRSENKLILQNLSIFVFKAFELRNKQTQL